jgi:hypothetical protein
MLQFPPTLTNFETMFGFIDILSKGKIRREKIVLCDHTFRDIITPSSFMSTSWWGCGYLLIYLTIFLWATQALITNEESIKPLLMFLELCFNFHQHSQNVKRTKQLYPSYRLDRQMFSVSVVHKLYQHAAKKMTVGRNVIDGIRKIVWVR